MNQRGTGNRYVVFVVVITLILWGAVFLTLSRNQDNLAGQGFGQFQINVTQVLRAMGEMGTENNFCRAAEPRCNAGLVCINNKCGRISAMYPFFMANVSLAIADLNPKIEKQPVVKDLFTQPASPGMLGSVCRETEPFCNQGLVCKNRKCTQQLLLPQTGDELVKNPDVRVETPEQRQAREQEEAEAHFFEQQREADRTQRRNACQEEYQQFVQNGRTDTKCSACFEFNITDPDCCCSDPAQVVGVTPEQLRTACEALPRRMVCPVLVEIERPPFRFDNPNREICEAPNPNDVIPEGAYFYDIEGGRHIDVCQDETHVRHIACFEEEITEQITPCPPETTCEAGRCGGNEIFICTDNDPRNRVEQRGDIRYRDNYNSDYCEQNSYTVLDQYNCRPQRNIRCDGQGNCDFTLLQQDVCDAFCYEGRCASPEDFDLDIPFFDPEDVEFTCEDSDGGNDPLVRGEATVSVHYDILGVEILDEEIRAGLDTCTYERLEEDGNQMYCRDTSKVMEATCTQRFGVPSLEHNNVPCPEGTACFHGACRPEETLYCTDSDEGDNREVYGEVIVGVRDGEQNREINSDSCGMDRCYETFCRDLADCSISYPRPEGLVNDDAYRMDEIREQFGFDDEIPMQGPCIDYDFGNQPFIGGYAQDEERGIHTDQCINADTLREMVCENEQLSEVVTPCAFGCEAGDADRNLVRQYDHCIACNNNDDCEEGQWCDGFQNRCRQQDLVEQEEPIELPDE